MEKTHLETYSVIIGDILPCFISALSVSLHFISWFVCLKLETFSEITKIHILLNFDVPCFSPVYLRGKKHKQHFYSSTILLPQMSFLR